MKGIWHQRLCVHGSCSQERRADFNHTFQNGGGVEKHSKLMGIFCVIRNSSCLLPLQQYILEGKGKKAHRDEKPDRESFTFPGFLLYVTGSPRRAELSDGLKNSTFWGIIGIENGSQDQSHTNSNPSAQFNPENLLIPVLVTF